ncbi:hypothetical protein BC938DRAFT_470813 [Jimgerdemannia flammicorona]|uniref:Uncharacterized protein n=1 Tax=Jimgerdemannia flammicorona TaxID=994334 RepID=A0A433Q9A7_9FUNG|nr:hypothetical protein BC938DRAFT_470813 [Jimgerdemannia flammicorona]
MRTMAILSVVSFLHHRYDLLLISRTMGRHQCCRRRRAGVEHLHAQVTDPAYKQKITSPPPESMASSYTVAMSARSLCRFQREELKPRIETCFHTAAEATGCGVKIQWREGIIYDLSTVHTICLHRRPR